VIAFRDDNHNEKFDDGEAGWIGDALGAGNVNSSRQFPVQEITLSTTFQQAPALMEELRNLRGGRSLADLKEGKEIAISLGQIVDLDAPRFSPDAGSLGLWQPATFLNQYGITIGLLEAYDPKRIPVLLVHGAGGTAADWKAFVPLLDTTRYQILLYSYPSGIRLEDLARILARSIERLHARYSFERLHIVAHSMGGLVSRSCLLHLTKNGPVSYLDRFVTLSTPWSGHEAAALGVKHAPVAIPSWIDMASGSEFQRDLFQQKLPPTIKYSLGFSYRGSGSMVLPDSNDGTVSIASELAIPAQNEAVAIRGFDETHMSILESAEAAKWVMEQLR
jgi:pimeloyl-ACP methyl ester carboxylesterase